MGAQAGLLAAGTTLYRASDLEVGLGLGGQHTLQNLFHGHGVGAAPPRGEEIAGARPLFVPVSGGVVIVGAAEFDREIVEGDAI